jgi:hypothetical protein
MKTINETTIKAMGKEIKLSVIDGKVMIETKKGNLEVSYVNKNRIGFLDAGKEIVVDFSENEQLAAALFNATKKGCELNSFESYEEYLKQKTEKHGADFDVNRVVHAYKYA